MAEPCYIVVTAWAFGIPDEMRFEWFVPRLHRARAEVDGLAFHEWVYSSARVGRRGFPMPGTAMGWQALAWDHHGA